MTTAPRHPSLPSIADDATPRALVGAGVRVAWTIAIDAIRAARPDLSLRAHAREAALVWAFAPGGEARASIEIDGAALDFPIVPAGLGADVQLDPQSRTLHIRVPGFVEIVLDHPSESLDAERANPESQHGPIVLYARTSLFGAIGLPGGSYKLATRHPRA